ncbi:MAG: glutamine--scyllo-inositol aminotransferase [Thaumarchaeota archaeon]|nr:MAG: glutamine--scyllo-inositol aminotransferase [Nitrososphaerota archaeon]
MKKKIKLFDPLIGKDEEKILVNSLKSHFWASGAGTGHVSNFESEFNKYVGSDNCVAVNSGTSALHLALSLIDIKNREVILPSLSFVSTAHAILYNGGKPVFADIDPHTLCLDHQSVENKITNKTKVILPVHFAGIPCNLEKISHLCKQHEIDLIEDAAHAAGSSYNDKKIGSHGMAICFSFHPTKNLAMPTGGAITLNGKHSKKFTHTLKSKRWCGIDNRKDSKYDVTSLGWNYYMNEFSAAIGRIQLKKLDSMNKVRKKIAKQYVEEIKLGRKMGFCSNSSYHLYWIQVNNRKKFMETMKDNGIETGIHYTPIHKMTYYKSSIKLPITEKISKNIVSIPIHPNLSESDINKIIKLINKHTS